MEDLLIETNSISMTNIFNNGVNQLHPYYGLFRYDKQLIDRTWRVKCKINKLTKNEFMSLKHQYNTYLLKT